MKKHRNPTRSRLNKFWAVVRSFSPNRFSKANLNGAWRKALDEDRQRLFRWMKHPMGGWREMTNVTPDKYNLS